MSELEPGSVHEVIVRRLCDHDYDRSDILGHWVDDEWWCDGIKSQRYREIREMDLVAVEYLEDR